MRAEDLKELLKSVRRTCYLRCKHGVIEVIEEISRDTASNAIQGKIIGSDDPSRVGVEVNVCLEHVTEIDK